MTRLPVGTPIRVTEYVFAGRTGVVIDFTDWRAKSFPEYQNVRLDEHGTEYLERIDWLEPLESRGQIDLFGGAP